MKSFSFRRLLPGLLLCLIASDVWAVPAFARRYDVACSFCHRIFPKLNRMGERFKERGFRLENEDKFESSAWLKSFPISGRLKGTDTLREDAKDTRAGFLKVLSAGNLGTKVSYWADDAWIRANEDTRHVKPDNLWMRYDLKANGKLYAKAGRFELDYLLTQARTPHLVGYQAYNVSTGLETDSIGQYQEGLEVGGEIGTTHLSAALVKGRNNADVVALSESSGVGDAGGFDGNLFLRAARRLTNSRFGVFSYIGRNDLVARLSATQVGVAKDKILRLGVDGSGWIGKLNLYGLGVYGRNSNSVLSLAQPTGTRESLAFTGGLLGADYHLKDYLAITARGQARSVDIPGSSTKSTLSQFVPGVQIVIWKIKLSGQAVFSNHNVATVGILQVETAF